jgi:lipopolysaccharide export system permease protein
MSHLLALFGFFSLILVAVYWVNRAVGLFDQLIGDGQSALVFLEFSVLTLPNVVRLVLPVSAFAACLYAINRLMQESELVVMQATGFSAFRLARPVLYVGLCVAAMELVLVNLLVPLSQGRLADRTAEISDNVTARFLNEGRFMHPATGVTIYIRRITQLGELEDIFLADDRDPVERVVYTAERALLVRSDPGPSLGDAGRRRAAAGPAKRAAGDHPVLQLFSMDLSGILGASGRGRLSVNELSTVRLLWPAEADMQATGESRAVLLEEGHGRLALALMALAAPLLGFSALMLGGYSRFGLWPQMMLALGLLIGMQMTSTAASGVAMGDDRAWPLVYVAPLLGLAVSGALLWQAQRPRRRRSLGVAG